MKKSSGGKSSRYKKRRSLDERHPRSKRLPNLDFILSSDPHTPPATTPSNSPKGRRKTESSSTGSSPRKKNNLKNEALKQVGSSEFFREGSPLIMRVRRALSPRAAKSVPVEVGEKLSNGDQLRKKLQQHNRKFREKRGRILERLDKDITIKNDDLLDPTALLKILQDPELIEYVEDRKEEIKNVEQEDISAFMRNLFEEELPHFLVLFLQDKDFLDFYLEEGNNYLSEKDDSRFFTILTIAIIMELQSLDCVEKFDQAFRASSLAIRLTTGFIELKSRLIVNDSWCKLLEGYLDKKEHWYLKFEDFGGLINKLAIKIENFEFGDAIEKITALYYYLFSCRAPLFALLDQMKAIESEKNKIREKFIADVEKAQGELINRFQLINIELKAQVTKFQSFLEGAKGDAVSLRTQIANLNGVINDNNNQISTSRNMIEEAREEGEVKLKQFDKAHAAEVRKLKGEIEQIRKLSLIDSLRQTSKFGSGEKSIFKLLGSMRWLRFVPTILGVAGAPETKAKKFLLTVLKYLNKSVVHSGEVAESTEDDSQCDVKEEDLMKLSRVHTKHTHKMIGEVPEFALISLFNGRVTFPNKPFFEHIPHVNFQKQTGNFGSKQNVVGQARGGTKMLTWIRENPNEEEDSTKTQRCSKGSIDYE